MGESSSMMTEARWLPELLFSLEGRRNSDRPDSPRSEMVGNDIPPAGPKVADFMAESMCGEEVECLRARLCRIGPIAGDGGTSILVARRLSPGPSVFRLS